MKKEIILSIVVVLIILGGIGIGYGIYNESNNIDSKLSADEIYEQKISDGYANVVFPEKLSTVYEYASYNFSKNETFVDINGSGTYYKIVYDTNLKKIYADIDGTRDYFDIENVKSFFVLKMGTASGGNEHLFILTNTGNLYYKYELSYISVEEIKKGLKKFKLTNTYDELKILRYATLTPFNGDDWELVGIKDNKMYSIGYGRFDFVFDEKKYTNERFDYVISDLYREFGTNCLIEKSGKIKLYNDNDNFEYSDVTVKNILSLTYYEGIIFISEDNYLYSISDYFVNKMNEKKVKYVLEKNNVIVIFEDGSIKELDIELAKY